MKPHPTTLGELKASGYERRSVKDELRTNLVRKLRDGETLFPGVRGYEETVIPQIVNAILARHDFILLGLRGQAKSRVLRNLSRFLDETIPVVAGGDLNDDPFRPVSARARLMLTPGSQDTGKADAETSRDDCVGESRRSDCALCLLPPTASFFDLC